LEPDAFSGAVAGPGRRVSAEGRAATEDWELHVVRPRRVFEENHFSSFCFFRGWLHGREQDRGSRSTRKHTAAAQTHVLQVCADVACSCCSCSTDSTRVLGVPVLRTHRNSITLLHPALRPLPDGKKKTFFPSTHHNSQRLQALGVLLRSHWVGAHFFDVFDGCASSGEGPWHF
jgi:hypothetical protein